MRDPGRGPVPGAQERRASVVPDHIDTLTPDGVRLRSGRELPADIIVTATGLKLLALGGITPSVDGRRVELSEQFIWRGAMVTGLPNLAVCVGYTNACWTLRADLTSRLVCRVVNHMERHRHASVVPTPGRSLARRPLLDLSSGYIQRAVDAFPRQGDCGPWRVRQNHVLDAVSTLRGDLRRELVGTPRELLLRSGPVAEAVHDEVQHAVGGTDVG